eukprot:15440259-Alexandrium_andersonii.AAC.1
MPHSMQESRLGAACVFYLTQWLHILDTNWHWLSHEEAARAETAGRSFLRTYQDLAARSVEANTKL